MFEEVIVGFGMMMGDGFVGNLRVVWYWDCVRWVLDFFEGDWGGVVGGGYFELLFCVGRGIG